MSVKLARASEALVSGVVADFAEGNFGVACVAGVVGLEVGVLCACVANLAVWGAGRAVGFEGGAELTDVGDRIVAFVAGETLSLLWVADCTL